MASHAERLIEEVHPHALAEAGSPSEGAVHPLTFATACGISAGLTYGIVELAFRVLLPWLLLPADEFVGIGAAAAATAMSVYALGGAVLGALTGVVVSRRNRRGTETDPDRLAALVGAGWTLAAAVILAGHDMGGRSGWISLLMYAVPALAALLTLTGALRGTRLSANRVAGRPRRSKRTSWMERFSSPTGSAVVMVVAPWMLERLGAVPPIFAGPVSVAVAAGLAAAGGAAWRRLTTRTGGSRRRRGLTPRLVLAALAVALASACLEQQPLAGAGPVGNPAEPRPNVAVIVLDTVRADHLSIYGYEHRTTPNLAAFAKSATLYQRAMAAGDMTLTSHGSLFTGLYGRRHGAHFALAREDSGGAVVQLSPDAPFFGHMLGEEHRTLAEILRDKGYRTAAVVANHAFVSPRFGLEQGFEHFDYRSPTPVFGETSPPLLRAALARTAAGYLPLAWSEQRFRSAAEVNEAAFEQLETLAAGGRPFFLFVNYMDAHHPHLPPPPFSERYPGRSMRLTCEEYWEIRRQVWSGERPLTEAEKAHMVSQYDGAIAYLDERLAVLLERLERLSNPGGTLIVVTSDHGEAFGEHGLLDHGVSVYQELIHVPLVIRFPGQREGRNVAAPVSTVDILPTVLEVAGIPIPAGLDGRSLAGGRPPEERAVLSESFPVAAQAALRPEFRRTERALIRGGAKLITSDRGKRELYDLEADPAELRNRYGEAPADAAALEEALERQLALSPAPVRRKQRPDQRTMEQLRSLGYVQ